MTGEATPWIVSARKAVENEEEIYRSSRGKVKREIEALSKMRDSEVDFSDIPRQDPNDPKWKNAVVGRFYGPIKQPVALRLDADVLAWLKSKGSGYQSRINQMLRQQMISELKR